MKKSIPELRKELEDVQLKLQYKKGLQERKNLQRTIFYLKHPNAAKLKGHLSSSISQVAKSIKENQKSKNKSISTGKKVKPKILYKRKLIKNKKGYYKPVYKKVKIKHKTKSRGSDPYGLSNVWKIPHI
jgi:hypothetical protein